MSSSSSLPANTAIDTGKPSVSSPTSSSTLEPSSTINASIINNIIPEVERRDTNSDGKEGLRFDDVDVDDNGVSIWEGKEGFKVTELSTTINRKRKTPLPVFIDFFLNDKIKSSTIVAAAAHQQPPPPHYDHPEEEYPDERTQLGLGWAPYIPIKKTSTTLTTKSGDDEDPDLELRIGPPIQKRRWRPVLFPDGYWEIKKRLTKSDVNGSSRLLLHRKLVEHHVLVHLNHMQEAAINSTAGMEIAVLDVDTDTQHSLVLKLWPSSCCYVLSKNWTCDFVKRRGLAENREIGLRWDSYHSRLEFAVLNY